MDLYTAFVAFMMLLTIVVVGGCAVIVCVKDARGDYRRGSYSPKAQCLPRGYSRTTTMIPTGRPTTGGTQRAIVINLQQMKQMPNVEPWAVWDEEMEQMYQECKRENGFRSGGM